VGFALAALVVDGFWVVDAEGDSVLFENGADATNVVLISLDGPPLIFCVRVMLGVCAAGAPDVEESAKVVGSVVLTGVVNDTTIVGVVEANGLPTGTAVLVTAGALPFFEGRGMSDKAGPDEVWASSEKPVEEGDGDIDIAEVFDTDDDGAGDRGRVLGLPLESGLARFDGDGE
jgi:hypothetical protein